MPLLIPEDYEYLAKCTMRVEEDEATRYLMFRAWSLPPNLYTVDTVDVLVTIPTNYNDQGNDMFWVYPPLQRKDGQPISNLIQNEKHYAGLAWQRWSRHWEQRPWRVGIDNVRSIKRRIAWCLERGT